MEAHRQGGDVTITFVPSMPRIKCVSQCSINLPAFCHMSVHGMPPVLQLWFGARFGNQPLCFVFQAGCCMHNVTRTFHPKADRSSWRATVGWWPLFCTQTFGQAVSATLNILLQQAVGEACVKRAAAGAHQGTSFSHAPYRPAGTVTRCAEKSRHVAQDEARNSLTQRILVHRPTTILLIYSCRPNDFWPHL